ncbi:MAG: DUF2285 domain-containing protein [Amaricoccus sp.]|uniref:DUF2285 domain-containing protein n=1 Tax=Amaricoccus sp. TaxID=1872485 RepID=UPI00331539E7
MLPSPSASRDSPEGLYALLSVGLLAPVLLLSGGAAVEDPLAVLVPLDDDLPDRVEALVRFWRACCGLSPLREPRITAPQRRRLRLMLQATDGRGRGASYREIATALYDGDRVAAESWKTSSVRDAVIGLVQGGAAMVAGGYRHLLRRRRRR